ncbi:MAG: class IV adenylate cyclase [Candidatus Hydrothermarchaeales archaeon]
MLEIEVKARLRDTEALKNKLKEMGAKFVKSSTQEDVYFEHPSRDFASSDEALRLRKQERRITLTYKGPRIDRITKTREEHKVEVSDETEAREILERIGFRGVYEVKKQRDYYELGDFKVMLDKVEGLGDYIEVEKHKGDYDPQEIINFLKGLGVSEKDMERRSYLELLLKKSQT